MTELSRSEKTRLTIIKNIRREHPELSEVEAWDFYLARQKGHGVVGGRKSTGRPFTNKDLASKAGKAGAESRYGKKS